MAPTILLVPPSKPGYVRDTHYGCWHKRKFITYSWPPLMLYYLHALLPDSIVLDAPAHGLGVDATLDELVSLRPEVVLTSVGTFTAGDDALFLDKLMKRVGCRIVLFGEYAMTQPGAALQLADTVVTGEPEAAVRLYGPGVVKKKGIINAELVKNLDTIPFPKRLLNERELYHNPLAKRSPFTTLLASRGCPFGCIFCSVPAVYGRTHRERSAGNVLGELAQLEEQGFREVFFRDENLTLDRKSITALCRGMLEQGIRLKWMANSRVDTVDEETLALMHEAGCHLLKFGVESFSDSTLRVLKKGITVSQVRTAFSLCDDAGIDTVAHLLLGSPEEDERQIERNIAELLRLDPAYASFDVIMAYPGTGPAEMRSRPDTPPPLSQERLEALHDAAFTRFYLRPRTLARHIASIGSGEELLWKLKSTSQLWKGLLKSRFS